MYVNKSDNAGDEVKQNRNACLTTLPDGEPSVTDPVQSFVTTTRHQSAAPVIARFRAALASVQTSELERLYNRLPELDEHSRQAIRQFADCLVATMMRRPLESLRDESRNGSPNRLLDALQRLFQLTD